MGYTTLQTDILLGLGVSAISDTGQAYAQNEKTLHDYYAAINSGHLAITKGYFLDTIDMDFKKYILDINCKGQTHFRQKDKPLLEQYVFPALEELKERWIDRTYGDGFTLTGQGHYFIRNICSAFDLYLHKIESEKKLFSKSI